MTSGSLTRSETVARIPRPRPLRAWLGATAGYLVLAGLTAGLPSSALAITPVVPPGLPVPAGTPQTNTGGTAPAFGISATEFDVTLHAPRTVVDWASYDIAAGNTVKYTFDARNWIVLNRIQSPTTPVIAGTIVGQVNGAVGGNIWFASSNGLIFGNGAKVDAGGILISSAAPDLAGFLDPTNLAFNFPGSDVTGAPSIDLQAGSSITGHGGLVALISPTIIGEAGSSVTGSAGSNVLYGAARGYQLRLQQGAPGDFDLVDFIVSDPTLGSDSSLPLDLQNTTSANSVYVAAVSSSTAGSAVINLQGMITAQAAASDGGDIVLSGGGGFTGRAPGPAAGGVRDDIYLHQASASRDLIVQTAGAVSGQVFAPCDCASPPAPPPRNGALDPSQVSIWTAARDVRLTATGTISLGALTAGRNLASDSLALQANSLKVTGAATLKSESGDLDVAFLSYGGASTAAANGSMQFDSLRLGNTLKIQASANVVLGNGADPADGGPGLVTVAAGGDLKVKLGGAASFDTISAGGVADLKAASLTVGAVKAQQVLAQGGAVTIASATSAGDVYVSSTSGGATVGAASAGDDIYILATGGAASLKSATISGAGADTVGLAFAGNPDTAGNGHVVNVQSADGDTLLGLGQGAVTGATKVNVKAGQDATVDVTSAIPGGLSITATRDAVLRAPSVTFDAVQAGRDITLTATAGDFTGSKPLVATRNVTLGATGALTLGDVTANAGSISLTGGTVTAGAVSAAQDLTLKATGGAVTLTSFKVGRDLTAQGATLSLGQQIAPIGRDLTLTTSGDFTSATDLAAGRNITLSVGGAATLKGLTGPGTVDIVARDLALGGTVTAATVQIESASGALTVGGSGGSGGLSLDNGEFGRIHASQVNLYAGSTAGGARGDLTLLDLDVNPQATPLVNAFAGGGHNVLVQGTVAPTVSGGTLHIGDSGASAWQPNSILVSGAIGSASFSGGTYSNIRSFDDVRLFATQDIIVGSNRFIGLIQAAAPADIEIGRNKPSGVAPTASEQNRVLVVAGTLELSAAGKVVSQNTAPTPIQSVGLFLTGKTGAPDLLIDPPQVVDLYGSFISQSGVVVSSFSAGSGVPFAVIDSSGNPAVAPVGAVYRFNSCTVGTSQCSAAATVTSNLQQNTPILSTPDAGLGDAAAGGSDGGDESGGGSGGGGGGRGGTRSGPALLSIGPVDADEVLADPVATGAGSEEIWRKRKGDPAPRAKP